MIESRKTTNHLIDWNNPQDRINYFKNLRKFLSEIENVVKPISDIQKMFGGCGEVAMLADEVLGKFSEWNVYFIDVDEIPRVNLDEPKAEGKQ